MDHSVYYMANQRLRELEQHKMSFASNWLLCNTVMYKTDVPLSQSYTVQIVQSPVQIVQSPVYS